jgi:uncharacterized membrane protein YcaP (DUF421 family)
MKQENFTMDYTDLLITAGRATAVYFFFLFVVRLLGKREIGNLSAFDLIVALMMGEVVDEIIYGDVTMLKGFLAVGVVAAWHFINSWASFRSKFIDKLTESEAVVLVDNGQINYEMLARERISETELWSQLRLQGVAELSEIKQAMLEPDGAISVLKQDWAQPLQKRDLQKLLDRAA